MEHARSRSGVQAAYKRNTTELQALLAALGMLIGGETVFKGKLGSFGFICYWLGCLAFTCLAIVIAFLDARALRRQTRQAQHDLFQATLKQIETEAKARSHRTNHNRRAS